MARGGAQGGLNCLTHVLPRCLPTPTEEADGGGERLTGRVTHWAAAWSTRITPVPLPAFDTIRQGGPTRTSADVSVPGSPGFP